MASYVNLTDTCARRTKTTGDTAALAGFQSDINTAINIIASKRDWPELWREATLSLLAVDGDKNYPLQSDVNKVYQLRITSPDSYIRPLSFWRNFEYWEYMPTKANLGTSSPTAWYFAKPNTLSTGATQYQVSFDQKPDQSYTATYSYKVKTPPLVASTDVPFFDENYHHILIDYAIWMYAEREADPSLSANYYAVKWQNGMTELLMAHVQPQREQTPIPGV